MRVFCLESLGSRRVFVASSLSRVFSLEAEAAAIAALLGTRWVEGKVVSR